MDAQVPEAAAEIGEFLPPAPGVRHQHKVIDQVRHIDAQGHGQGHAAAGQQPPHRPLRHRRQGQLIHQHQQIAEIGVKAEHPRPDVSRLQQGGVQQQTQSPQQENARRRKPQSHVRRLLSQAEGGTVHLPVL